MLLCPAATKICETVIEECNIILAQFIDVRERVSPLLHCARSAACGPYRAERRRSEAMRTFFGIPHAFSGSSIWLYARTSRAFAS